MGVGFSQCCVDEGADSEGGSTRKLGGGKSRDGETNRNRNNLRVRVPSVDLSAVDFRKHGRGCLVSTQQTSNSASDLSVNEDSGGNSSAVVKPPSTPSAMKPPSPPCAIPGREITGHVALSTRRHSELADSIFSGARASTCEKQKNERSELLRTKSERLAPCGDKYGQRPLHALEHDDCTFVYEAQVSRSKKSLSALHRSNTIEDGLSALGDVQSDDEYADDDSNFAESKEGQNPCRNLLLRRRESIKLGLAHYNNNSISVSSSLGSSLSSSVEKPRNFFHEGSSVAFLDEIDGEQLGNEPGSQDLLLGLDQPVDVRNLDFSARVVGKLADVLHESNNPSCSFGDNESSRLEQTEASEAPQTSIGSMHHRSKSDRLSNYTAIRRFNKSKRTRLRHKRAASDATISSSPLFTEIAVDEASTMFARQRRREVQRKWESVILQCS